MLPDTPTIAILLRSVQCQAILVNFVKCVFRNKSVTCKMKKERYVCAIYEPKKGQ